MRITHTLAAAAGLAALAGLATTAAAQMSPNGWIIEIQDPILAPAGHSSGLPQSTTVEVYAKFDGDLDYAFAAGLFDFVASEGTLPNWSFNQRIAPFNAIPGAIFDGMLLPPEVLDVNPGQLHFPPAGIIGLDDNPALVWTIEYTATDFTERFIDLETVTSRFDLYIDESLPDSRTLDTSMLMEGMGQVQIIPAPGALACLGLAGLTLLRRRR